MANKVAKIGIITFKNFEENVIINEYFDTKELLKIFQDKDFVKFEIFDGDGLFYTTDKNVVVVELNDTETILCNIKYFGSICTLTRLNLNNRGQEIDAHETDFKILKKYGHYFSHILYFPEVERDETILGTTFNAFAKNRYSHKKKIKWIVKDNNHNEFRTKKQAETYKQFVIDKSLSRINNLKINSF